MPKLLLRRSVSIAINTLCKRNITPQTTSTFVIKKQNQRYFLSWTKAMEPAKVPENEYLDFISFTKSKDEVLKLVGAYEGTQSCEAVTSLEEWQERTQFWQACSRYGKEFQLFDVGRFLQDLKSASFGKLVLYAHSVPSTQTIMFQNARSLPTGTVCVTDIQNKGKGRGSNQWDSPPGCLMFTLNCAVTKGETVPMLQYLISMAIVQGIRSIDEFKALDVNIKWPNDIYAKKTIKIGGILSQSIHYNDSFRIFLGIGLNVDNCQPTSCLNDLAKAKVRRETILARILERFEALFNEFQVNGFTDKLKVEYERDWLHSNQIVEIMDKGARKAKINGISVSGGGCLLAEDLEDGSVYELYPDGNTLDFFQGLISKKKR